MWWTGVVITGISPHEHSTLLFHLSKTFTTYRAGMLQNLNGDAPSLPTDVVKNKDDLHRPSVFLFDFTREEDRPHGHRESIKEETPLRVLIVQTTTVEETMEKVLGCRYHHLSYTIE